MTGTHSPSTLSPKREPNLRKISKPLIEKKRRARINGCLSQLKDILLNTVAQSTTQISKLEKADILEMTVQYLQSIQMNKVASQSKSEIKQKYASGFRECASEVARYLKSTNNIDSELRQRLETHLGNCVHNLDFSLETSRGVLPSLNDNSRLSPLQIEIPATHRVKSEKKTMMGDYQQLLIPVYANNSNLVNNYNVFHHAPVTSAGFKDALSIQNNNNSGLVSSRSPGFLPGIQVRGDVWRPW